MPAKRSSKTSTAKRSSARTARVKAPDRPTPGPTPTPIPKPGRLAPDQIPLTALQASRLSSMSGVPAEALQGATVAQISDKFRFVIDPQLLFFRQICGRVVKHNPVTNLDEGVPFATVNVFDTDCSFFGLFPIESPWAWLFPIFCHTEEIGTTTTDECGNFCVWIPRWDIDWILRFRLERRCYIDVLRLPTIRDLLPLLEEAVPRIPPGPIPDPPPDLLSDGGITLRKAEQLLGHDVANSLVAASSGATFGASTAAASQILDHPSQLNLAPPIPASLAKAVADHGGNTKRLAAALGVPAERFSGLSLNQYVGPLFRCVDVLVPEVVPIIDIPDVTFQVTQDVDGDGTQEVIYSEGFFDVRWNAGDIPPVTLHASPIAVSSAICDVPPHVPCDDRSIYAINLYPVQNPPGPADPYLDGTLGSSSEGYARRPQRPHPLTGTFAEVPAPGTLSSSPFAGTLMLWGCNDYPGASYYRIRRSFDGGPSGVITGQSWPLFPTGGGPTIWVTPDPSGWYPIRAANDGYFPPSDLLLTWWSGDEGLNRINVEFGDAGKNSIHITPTALPIQVDNTPPYGHFTGLRWWPSGGGTITTLDPNQCPVIRRAAGQAIDIEVTFEASATHFRSVWLSGGGCGLVMSDPIYQSGSREHWYVDPTDNYFTNAGSPAVYSLAANVEGSISFALSVNGRAFRPDDATGFAADWEPWDPNNVSYSYPSFAIAVVNS